MKTNKSRKGFTIVELVIVVGVIGILSGILIPTFVGLTNQANEAALQSNLANAYSMYAAEAVDGKVDEGEYTIEFKGQNEVSLTLNEKVYEFNATSKKWEENASSTRTTLVVTSGTDEQKLAASTFNEAVVKYQAA